tara:strand:+ start:207 stop:557 length:351 start_codon:yes stop_codon:yes gene_type:complete
MGGVGSSGSGSGSGSMSIANGAGGEGVVEEGDDFACWGDDASLEEAEGDEMVVASVVLVVETKSGTTEEAVVATEGEVDNSLAASCCPCSFHACCIFSVYISQRCVISEQVSRHHA